MATTQQDKVSPLSAGLGILAGVTILGAVALDQLTPDTNHNYPLTFPTLIPRISGSFSRMADPYIGHKRFSELSLNISGKKGETYRIKIIGDRTMAEGLEPVVLDFRSKEPSRVYYDSGSIDFSSSNNRQINIRLDNVPGSEKIDLTYTAPGSDPTHVRSYLHELIK